jgi:hypothetical protein
MVSKFLPPDRKSRDYEIRKIDIVYLFDYHPKKVVHPMKKRKTDVIRFRTFLFERAFDRAE